MGRNYCYGCMKELNSDGTCSNCSFDINKYEIQPHQLRPGTILHERYVVGSVMGEGGFGITYVGIDDVLGLKVAVKEFYMSGFVNRNNTVSAHVSAETGEKGELFERNRERFFSEARVLAKFNTIDGIVSVRDFFYENDTAYIVMDFIEGKTLKDYLKEKQVLSVAKTFSIMNPLLDALAVVHEDGIIHRDISPDNILLEEGGKVKLIDFGAAREYSDENKSLSVILKPGYAPEEQYRTKGVQGPWTDVYALSATMYRCLGGRRPEDALERLSKDTMQTVHELNPECPKELSNIIMKGLAVHQENRFQTIEEMKIALSAVNIKAVKNHNLRIKQEKRHIKEDITAGEASRVTEYAGLDITERPVAEKKNKTGNKSPIQFIIPLVATQVLAILINLISPIVIFFYYEFLGYSDSLVSMHLSETYPVILIIVISVRLVLTALIIILFMRYLKKSDSSIWLPLDTILYDSGCFGNLGELYLSPEPVIISKMIQNMDYDVSLFRGSFRIPSGRNDCMDFLPTGVFKKSVNMIPLHDVFYADYSGAIVSHLPFQITFENDEGLCTLYYYKKGNKPRYYAMKARMEIEKEKNSEKLNLKFKPIVSENGGNIVFAEYMLEYEAYYRGIILTLTNNRKSVDLYNAGFAISKRSVNKVYRESFLARNYGNEIEGVDRIEFGLSVGRFIIRVVPDRKGKEIYDAVIRISENGKLEFSYRDNKGNKCAHEYFVLWSEKSIILTDDTGRYIYDRI